MMMQLTGTRDWRATKEVIMAQIVFFTAVAIAMLIVLGNSFQEVKKKADSRELSAKLISEGIKK